VRWLLGAVSLALTAVAVRPAFAGDDASDVPPPTPPPRPGLYTHDGFYLRYSIGPGLYRIGPGPNPGGLVEGATVSGVGVSEVLAIGGTLPHGVVLAGAASAVVTSSLVVANYGLLVDWFPDPAAGWHIGGQLGIGFVVDPYYDVAVASAVGDTFTPDDRAVGLGASLMGGYDAWVTPQFSMGVNLVAMTTAFARQHVPIDSTSYSLTPIAGGVMVSVLYH
jgi:hypothetical protein